MGNALVDGHLDGDMNEIMMLGTTSSVNQDRIICGLFEQIISNNPQITTALFAIICRLFVDYLRLFADYSGSSFVVLGSRPHPKYPTDLW